MKTFKELRQQDILKKLKKIKGITKDQLSALGSMNPATLQIVINQLSSLVAHNELDERSALVMSIPEIIKVMLKDIQAKLEKELKKGDTELANNIGRIVGLRVTTKGQQKNRAFLYDLEKGFRKTNPRGSSRGKR
tara:strand:- start:512 stop:916 length:405 start_codon:yes stop_codon:yes gene_type:complete